MKLSISIEKVFVIFALFFGMLFVLITPPFQSVDENFHFYRAYGIASGQFIAQKENNLSGSELPKSLTLLTSAYDGLVKNINAKTSFLEMKANSKIKLEKEDKIYTAYSNTALYSPVPYIAQSAGISIGNFFNLPPLLLVYIGRIFNLILYTILGYYAIKVIPILKPAVFLILLMPLNLSLGSSLSSDALLITSSLIFTGIILKYIVTDENLDNKSIVLLSFLALILALIKHHFFLMPLLFLIPRDRFGGKYLKCLCLMILPAAAGCFIWSKAISGLYIPLRDGADMYSQLAFIAHNPFVYALVLIKTIAVKTFRIIITMIGVLGWQDTRLDILTYMLYPPAIIYAVLNKFDVKFILSKMQALILSGVLIVSSILIVTYMYLSWSPVGSSIVTGLNGKYFITLLLPFFILIASKVKIRFDVSNNIIYTFSFFVLFSAIFSVLIRFYNMFPNLYYQV